MNDIEADQSRKALLTHTITNASGIARGRKSVGGNELTALTWYCCRMLQVYPFSWTAVYVALDNVGMWNVRTEFWARQYLGQQFYLRVYTDSTSLRDEYPIPKNALLCGKASGQHTRPS